MVWFFLLLRYLSTSFSFSVYWMKFRIFHEFMLWPNFAFNSILVSCENLSTKHLPEKSCCCCFCWQKEEKIKTVSLCFNWAIVSFCWWWVPFLTVFTCFSERINSHAGLLMYKFIFSITFLTFATECKRWCEWKKRSFYKWTENLDYELSFERIETQCVNNRNNNKQINHECLLNNQNWFNQNEPLELTYWKYH